MKYIIFFLLSCLILLASDSVNDDKNKVKTIEQNKTTVQIETVYQSGCCSWHGGVAGCSGGRVVCGDGMLSPSCTCNTNEPIDITIKKQ